MVVGIETTLIFATLVILVVIELSSRVSTEDLSERIDMAKRGPLWGFFPDLGIFTYIHVLNSFILAISYLVVFTNWMTNDSVAITLTLFLTALLLLLLPYLEIEGYDLIERESQSRLGSRRVHILFTLLIVIEPVLFQLISLAEGTRWGSIAEAITFSQFFVVLVLPMMIFINALEKELERSQKRNDIQTFLDDYD